MDLGDTDGASLSEPPTHPHPPYAKQPTSNGAKAVIGVCVAIVVIGALVIGSFVLGIYNQFGGVSHDPLDYTVRSARIQADKMARGDLEIIVKELTPTLGTPTKRAVLDMCSDNNSSWSFNNDIMCTRSLYLYYPIAGDPPSASSLTEAMTAATSKIHHVLGCETVGIQGSCDVKGGNIVLHRTTTALEKDSFYRYTGSPIEMDGYRDLVFAASKGPHVAVLDAVQYFEG
jgi:hypothetical protein